MLNSRALFPLDAEDATRRRQYLKAMAFGALSVGLAACDNKRVAALRVSCQVWPGYEFLYLARQLALFSDQSIHLIDAPNASSSIRALGAKACEAAALTLDEVLTARDRGIPLTVVAVLDVSNGADVLLARPQIKRLQDLKGHRVGVDQSATGAVMLDAALGVAKLPVGDLTLVPIPINDHEAAFVSGQVDALVTFEPVKSKLLKTGAHVLFSSAQVPGRILDTIAVRTNVLELYQDALKALVASHFNARQKWAENPAAHAEALARRMQLAPVELAEAYSELELPDLQANRRLLTGNNPPLLATARQLGDIMVRSGLLRSQPDLSFLIDGRFVS